MYGEGSTNTLRTLGREGATSGEPSDHRSPDPGPQALCRPDTSAAVQPPGNDDAQRAVETVSLPARRTLDEHSPSGSRILDLGSSIPSGRAAPDAPPHTNSLVAEYVAACGHRPPGDVIAHVGRVVKKLLGEGIGPDNVRAGLRRYAEIQGHPSRLPSLVNDAMNAVGGSARSANRLALPAAHSAWTNPVDPAAYTEDL